MGAGLIPGSRSLEQVLAQELANTDELERRYGAGMFLLILPNTPLDGVLELIDTVHSWGGK